MAEKSKWKEVLTLEPLKIIIGSVSLSLLGLLVAIVPQVRDRILAALPCGLLLALACIGIALSLGLTACCLYLQKELNAKLFPALGVKWSRKTLVPHCPACDRPLSNYDQYLFNSGMTWAFQCVGCKAHHHLFDESGKKLEMKEARQLLKA